MRISTQALHATAVAAMLEQQSQLSKLQNQVATGKRVQTPADDPVAAVHILELERAKSESDQFGQNITMAKSRLTLEEQGISDATTVMTRVRELVVQASNTGTLTDSDRASIATELSARTQELQDIANRKDGGGEYLQRLRRIPAAAPSMSAA
jgi:flagellar hook-associated protein 3 FlgL